MENNNNNNTKIAPLVASLLVCAAGPAAALNSGDYSVSNATDTHGLWLDSSAELGNYFPILDGSFVVDASAGTALLEMTTWSGGFLDGGFDVSVSLNYVCSGLEVGLAGCDSFSLPQIDGNVDTTLADQQGWEFFYIDGGTLTGTGVLEGMLISINTRPADGSKPFRMGTGANWFDIDFGASGWFDFVVDNNTSGIDLDIDSATGDLNMDLELATIPLPAGVWLLISGLAGLGAVRRRR